MQNVLKHFHYDTQITGLINFILDDGQMSVDKLLYTHSAAHTHYGGNFSFSRKIGQFDGHLSVEYSN